ncbi:peptidase S8 [Thermoplasmatales archaeon ex4484_36]|nr:MAG: peptidase S8 [Thermoplasmatales archaeon ex4484_36]
MSVKTIIGLSVVLIFMGTLVGSAEGAPPEKVRVVITVEEDFSSEAITSAGGRVVSSSELFHIVVAELPEKAVSSLQRSQGVVKVEYDSAVHLSKKPPAPPGKNKPAPQQPPQQTPWGITRIGATTAWSSSNGSSDDGVIEVAILDTGIDPDHPDLKANLKWGVSVIRGRISTSPKDYKDKNGHGTHVAGTVAALNNNIGVVGVAPAVEIYAIRVLGASGSGTYGDIILGIEQALLGPDGVLDSDGDGAVAGDPDDDSAEVISMSLSGSADLSSLHSAIVTAYGYGVVIVAASGNDGSAQPGYPAAYSEVIAVGATDSSDQVPWWSNRGVELTAPGVGVQSTYPDDTYNTLSGTSMATPHVSGVVALVQAARYNIYGGVLQPASVRSILHSTADDKGTQGYDTIYGYGIVRADRAVGAATS